MSRSCNYTDCAHTIVGVFAYLIAVPRGIGGGVGVSVRADHSIEECRAPDWIDGIDGGVRDRHVDADA